MPKKIKKFIQENKFYAIIAANLIFFASLTYVIFGLAIKNPNHLYIGVEGDSSYYIWITKWFSRLFSHPDFSHITNVFFPIGIDISAGWEGSILFYVGGFFNLFFSEPAAYNLLILFPLLLDWAAFYFVFNKFSGRIFLSGTFASLFAISSFFMARSLGHPSYLYFFHIPLLFYFLQYEWLKALDLKKALLLILVYVLISITSWYYFIFTAIITAVYLLGFIIKTGKSNCALYKKIALTYLGVVLAVLIFNFPMFKAFFFGSDYFYPYPFHMNNDEPNQQNSMLLADYLKPSTLNTFYSNTPSWQIGNIEKNLFPGISFFILLAISIYYIFRKKEFGKHAELAFIALIFIVLSLGYNSPLPLYKWLNSLPIISTLHAPSRFGIVVILLGWLIIAKNSRYMRGRLMACILILLIVFQFYEASFFSVPFQNFDNVKILQSLKSGETSPVLEIPLRLHASKTLLLPALSEKPVFSGYPQHTTYSPRLENIVRSNALDYLTVDTRDKEDIIATLSPRETAAYLSGKYDLKNIVVDKSIPLNSKSEELLAYFDLKLENGSYAIYELNKKTLPEYIEGVRIVTGKGVGKLANRRRSLGENSEFDIMNFTGKAQKLNLNFEFEALASETEYSIAGKKVVPDFEIISQPGVGAFTISSNKKCTLQGADCITGYLYKINITGED